MMHKHQRFCLVFLALFLIPTFISSPISLQQNGGFYTFKTQNVQAETNKKKVVKKQAQASKKKSAKRNARKTSAKRKAKSSAPDIPQTESSRWAAIVVDANDGSILYEKNAESARHPASLTKMMTLYLLFEALESRRYTMNSLLNVSAKAAAQPQTNIALNADDRISVQTSINALIIRSANDVAMVVAENIGGSQEGFARIMNRKARELGMTNTRFYNPAGLPDDRQISTAADMARLGIALKRDFPQYYDFFKRTSFSYNGKTYKTHNRVVGRYPGADGIKTGYIRASGFNLVTSVTRGKTRLVGVVMGGYSASSRDQEMMNMLDRVMFAGAGKSKPTQAQTRTPEEKFEIAEEPAVTPPSSTDLPATNQTIEPASPPSFVSERNWAIQVGAFPTLDQAERAARAARSLATEELEKAQVQISQVMKDETVFNRARLIYLTSDQARNACQRLSESKKQCLVIRME